MRGEGLARRAGPGRDFNEVTQGAEKVEGLFTLYRKGEHLYAEFLPHQLNQPLLVPVTIARGIGQTGVPITRADEPVIIFRRVDDRIQLVRRNIHFKATPGSSLDKSVKQNYTDSVLMALPIVAVNMMRGGAVLIDLSDIFMTDFAQLGLGTVDRSRCSWVEGRRDSTNNMELEVETTFSGWPTVDDGPERPGRRPPGHHDRHALQPDAGLPGSATTPGWLTTASATS